MKKAICQVVLDARGHHAQGINTYDESHAARWAREVCRAVKNTGFMASPYVVGFEPAHHGWADNAAIRVLRRLGADCSLRHDGIIEVRNASESVCAAAVRLGLEIHSAVAGTLEFHAPTDDTHGLKVLKAIHRIHADVIRKQDGSIELQNLHHYPEREPGDQTGASAAHPFLTKRQWVRIPQVVSKRHWIVTAPEKTS